MKKALYTATVVRTHINAFHLPFLQMLKEDGWEVHVAAKNDYADGNCTIPHCDRYFNIPFTRNPFSRKNIRIYKQLKKLIESEQYTMVHCHTPVASVITRLAARRARKKYGTKVLYTAHGFHFYKGAKKKNWLLFYPIEWLCAHITDCIITINHEDYRCVKDRFSSKTTFVERIDSVGVDLSRFTPASADEKEELKEKNGYGGKFILTYAAEFIPRKNHRFFVENIKALSERCPNVQILFAGSGSLFEEIRQLAWELGVSERIEFLGFCTNMPVLLKMSDLIVSASVEEGFGINLVEGMACGLPAVASVVRGHKEMVADGQNGFLFHVNSPDEFIDAVYKFYSDKVLYERFSKNARQSAKKFSIENARRQLAEIYRKHLEEFTFRQESDT